VPLATYKYRNAPERDIQLGFVLEDVEPSMCVDTQRNQVDLYGYATMAVAAIKVQAEQIQALKAEIESLRLEIKGLLLPAVHETKK